MKNLALTFMLIFAGLSYAQDSQAEFGNEERRSLFVGIVVDSSPASNRAWNIKKSRAVELLSNLKQGEKVVVLKARPGSPSICGKAVIGGPEKTGSNEIVSCVSGLNKELLFSADVARACESIYDIFVSEGSGFKCLLVVLTNGKLSSNQVQRIIRTSSQIKTLKGFSCLTYDPAVTKQDLIIAGKKNDIEMLLESNPGFANWIKSKQDEIEPEKIVDKKPEYVFVEPDLTPIKTMIDNAFTSLKPNINNPTPPKSIPLPQVQETDVVKSSVNLEPNTISTDTANDINIPTEVNVEDQDIGQSQTKSLSLMSWILILSAATMMLTILILFISKHLKKAGAAYDDDEQQQPSNLKATVGEQDIDLGDIELISELTMGNDPGCGIFIEDDNISPQQARIFRAGKGFKLQNLDAEPVIVNGIEAKCKKKVKLDIPADIQLANGVMLNLYTETVCDIKDDDNE